jgi:hypothetical protein
MSHYIQIAKQHSVEFLRYSQSFLYGSQRMQRPDKLYQRVYFKKCILYGIHFVPLGIQTVKWLD